jgi:hypothetical protein
MGSGSGCGSTTSLPCTCHFSEHRYFCLEVLATAGDSEAAGADLTATGADLTAAGAASMAAGVSE